MHLIKFLFIKLILVMKNVMKSLSILLLASVVFASCGKDNKDNNGKQTESVPVPTNLSVTNITDVSAKLQWAGTADSYEILLSSQFSSNIPFSSTTTSCDLTNLTENTVYTLKIRAKKGSEFSDWVEGTMFTTANAQGVTVTFGTVRWTAALAGALDYGDNYFYLKAFKVNNTTLPIIDFLINKTGTSTIVFPLPEGQVVYADYWEIEEHLIGIGSSTYGDWWTEEGTITITSKTGTKISGFAELKMINVYQFYVEEKAQADCEHRTLSVFFKNLDIIDMSSASIQKSLTTSEFGRRTFGKK